MIVTATEFKTNLGKYLELAAVQDVLITKNGKNIARLTSPTISKLSVLNSLVGIIPSQEDINTESMREERLGRQ
jgi:prevent-host-death family protein